MSAGMIDPRRCALLLLDFQELVLKQRPLLEGVDGDGGAVSDPAGVIAGARNARAIANAHRIQVVFVKLRLTPQDISCISPRNKPFHVVTSGGFPPEGSPELEFSPELAPEVGDIVVAKSRFGAFSTTNLDRMLRGRDIDTLFIGGTYTSGVVLSTVRDACDRDYQLFVVSDACGDADADLHDVLMTKVLPVQAEIITSADMERILESRVTKA